MWGLGLPSDHGMDNENMRTSSGHVQKEVEVSVAAMTLCPANAVCRSHPYMVKINRKPRQSIVRKG